MSFRSRSITITALSAFVTITTLSACGSSSNGNAQPKTCGTPTSGGGLLQPFTPPCTDQGSNAILVTASGEVLALGGYGFPPASADDVAFVDGWALEFSKVLVTFDHVTLSESPDRSPGDQSQTGALVAQADGPWAVDLHKGGALPGKGGAGEQATPITAFTGQNKKGNAAFDPTLRYAFGFDIVAATPSAKNVNLDTSDLTDYQDMINKGYTALFVGTATWHGGTSCTQSAAYDFTAPHFPQTVNFRFGFKSPVTNINCQNPDNDPASPLDGEEHQRGVALRANQTTIAQATFHTDHAFWESFVHDSPAHFDQIAAQYVGSSSAPTATLEDLASVTNFATGFTDKAGAALPWRKCLDTFTLPNNQAQMRFDTGGISLANLRDAMTWSESTMGHLNADGLCFTNRHY